MKRSVATKLLHGLLAVVIVHQLVLSLFMEMPRHGRAGDFGFELHQYVGIAGMSILCLYWLWIVLRRREHHLLALVPWFQATRRQAVWTDLSMQVRTISKFTIPLPREETPLASAVHGLGLMMASLMAITGTAIYLLAAPDGSVSGFGKTILEIHQLFANLIWAYILAHVSLALLHQASGHKLLQRMF